MNISTPEVKEVIKRAFPGYNGRRIQVLPFTGPKKLTSYWSGGSRDYWAVVALDAARSTNVLTAPQNGTMFDAGDITLPALPEGCALVRHTAGPYESAAIYVNEANLAKMLPAPVELSTGERTVLTYTAKLKSSYAGIKNYRFHEAHRDTGITIESWDLGKASCIDRGLLNKAGAITESGRNAIAA